MAGSEELQPRGPWRRLLTRRAGGLATLRLVASGVLLVCFSIGALASYGLLKAGVTDPVLRFPLVVALAYAVFLALIRVWLGHARVAEGAVQPDPDHREEPEGSTSIAREFMEKTGEVADGLSSLADVGSLADAEGCLPVIGLMALLALAAVVVAALWWMLSGFFGAATAALVEAGAEAMMAVAMARVAGGSPGRWLEGALRASWLHWLGLEILAMILGGMVRAIDPSANTLLQLLH